MIDLAKATMQELKVEFKNLAVQMDSVESQRKQIWEEITRRKNSAAAKAAIGSLSTDERAALKEVLA